jgi:hypothetical protein
MNMSKADGEKGSSPCAAPAPAQETKRDRRLRRTKAAFVFLFDVAKLVVSAVRGR